MNKSWIFTFAMFSMLHVAGSAETIDQWEDPNDDLPGLQQVDYEVSYVSPLDNEGGVSSPTRLRARQQWQNDRFAENQFQESSWPARREELSDQLSH